MTNRGHNANKSRRFRAGALNRKLGREQRENAKFERKTQRLIAKAIKLKGENE